MGRTREIDPGLVAGNLETYWVLVKIMAPVMVAAKVTADLGAVAAMARGFEPIMALVGPGGMGIVGSQPPINLRGPPPWSRSCRTVP